MWLAEPLRGANFPQTHARQQGRWRREVSQPTGAWQKLARRSLGTGTFFGLKLGKINVGWWDGHVDSSSTTKTETLLVLKGRSLILGHLCVGYFKRQ